MATPPTMQLAGTLEPARIFDALVAELQADYLARAEQRRWPRILPKRRRERHHA